MNSVADESSLWITPKTLFRIFCFYFFISILFYSETKSHVRIYNLKYSLLPIKSKLEITKLFQGIYNETLAQILYKYTH